MYVILLSDRNINYSFVTVNIQKGVEELVLLVMVKPTLFSVFILTDLLMYPRYPSVNLDKFICPVRGAYF